MKKNVFYIQDGDSVPNNIKKIINGIKTSQSLIQGKHNNCHFTGKLSDNNGHIIFSFPKHYTLNINEHKLNPNIIIKAIQKAKENIKKKRIKGSRDIHFLNSVHDTFPLNFFWKIYKYYQQFGRYHQNLTQYKRGFGGHISWKKTIERSNVFISHKSFIYLPFIIKSKSKIITIISRCMDSAIIYTKLHRHIHVIYPQVNYDKRLLIHSSNTAKILRLIYRKTYNSNTKILLYNLFMFYKKIKHNYSIYTTSTSLVWEDAVNKFLNTHLSIINTLENSGRPTFISRLDKPNHFIHQPNTKIPAGYLYNFGQKNKHETILQPDHYLKIFSIKFIFDSKYYNDIRSFDGKNGLELNTKQIVYHLYARDLRLDKNNNLTPKYRVIDSVVLPTYKQSFAHTYFVSRPIDSKPIKIWVSYLNANDVFRNYIN